MPKDDNKTTPKTEYQDNHLDISGFGTNSENPKAPLANLKQYITREGLEAQLAELDAAKVDEAEIEMVMFGGEFNRKGTGEEGSWFRVVRSRGNKTQRKTL